MHKFELSTVNPTFVIGPSLMRNDYPSAGIISMLMNGEIPGGIPNLSSSVVDVREVAQAHLNCIECDDAQGNRHLLANKTVWWTEIAALLEKNYG